MTTGNGSKNTVKNRFSDGEAIKKRAPRKQPERVHIDTRLYAKKDEQLLLQIYDLIDQKKYTQTFRDAFRLILSLQQGDTSVLIELFPDLANKPLNQGQLDAYFKPFIKQLMTDQFLGADLD